MAYLELPLIAIAAVGTIIAIVIAQRDLQLKNMSVHAVQSDAAVNATIDQEEEDFFQ
ncbi:hypothetical protein [Enterococcus avium]|nr:hypothetical protein [Enterococcus avium]